MCLDIDFLGLILVVVQWPSRIYKFTSFAKFGKLSSIISSTAFELCTYFSHRETPMTWTLLCPGPLKLFSWEPFHFCREWLYIVATVGSALGCLGSRGRRAEISWYPYLCGRQYLRGILWGSWGRISVSTSKTRAMKTVPGRCFGALAQHWHSLTDGCCLWTHIRKIAWWRGLPSGGSWSQGGRASLGGWVLSRTSCSSHGTSFLPGGAADGPWAFGRHFLENEQSELAL